MEGSNCIAANVDDEETLLIPVSCVMHVTSCPNDPLLGPKDRTMRLEKHPFCICV